jgi:hypothetical protein
MHHESHSGWGYALNYTNPVTPLLLSEAPQRGNLPARGAFRGTRSALARGISDRQMTWFLYFAAWRHSLRYDVQRGAVVAMSAWRTPTKCVVQAGTISSGLRHVPGGAVEQSRRF